jgi:drug/metabolite transporter (DMT)-like permease
MSVSEKRGLKIRMGFVYLGLTILFTVYSQLVFKWQISQAGTPPPDMAERMVFFLRQYFTPWIISGMISGFLASFAWMATLNEFQLSFAYPFMSLSYVVVLAASFLLFHEPFSIQKVAGTAVVILGLVIITR